MMDSNTSLPSMLTPKHFLTVSVQSVWTDRIWPALAFQAGFLNKAVIERLVLPGL